MTNYVFDKKGLKKVDKIEELGNKICRYVEYVAESKKGRALELAALADILFSIREIFKIYNERFKELEKINLEHQEINETGGINSIKIILGDPILEKERR